MGRMLSVEETVKVMVGLLGMVDVAGRRFCFRCVEWWRFALDASSGGGYAADEIGGGHCGSEGA